MSKPCDPLRDTKLKIERAKSHILDLNQAVRAFIESKPYTMFEEVHPDRVNKNIKVRQWRKLPTNIELIAADAIHNLRVSLDQLTCCLAKANGLSDMAGVAFPFAENADKLENREHRRKIEKLHPDARAMIKALKPYPGGNGNARLWAIHALDITDKHREIVAMGSVNTGVRARLLGKDIHAGPDGTSVVIRGPLQVISNSAWNPLDESTVVMIVPADLTFDGQISLSLNVAFREIESVKGEPIVSVLNQLADLVEGILLSFEARFF